MSKRPRVEAPFPLVSASQVTSFDVESEGCPRKWLLKSVLKLETAQGSAAALGEDIDSNQLDPYLTEGRPLDFSKSNRSGYIAQTALRYLPPPKTPGVVCQKHFILPTWSQPPAGVEVEGTPHFGYQGYLDVHAPDSSVFPNRPEAWVIGQVFVGDFKSTGSWKWRKTEEDLKVDVQATLYAKWAMFHYNVDVVDLAWFYMLTKGATKCEPTYLRTTAEIVDKRFAEIEAIANDMFVIKAFAPKRVKVPGIDDLPDGQEHVDQGPFAMQRRNDDRVKANPALKAYIDEVPAHLPTCDAFGGCPFKGTCNFSPKETVQLMKLKDGKLDSEELTKEAKKQLMSVRERLMAKKAAANGATPTTNEQAPAPAPINPPESALPPKAVEASAIKPPAEQPAAAAPKGRPKKTAAASKAKADAVTEPVTEAESTAPTTAPTKDSEGIEFEYRQPLETFQPRQFEPLQIGGHVVRDRVRAGETLATAMSRVASQLMAVRSQEFAVICEANSEAKAKLEAA